MIVVFDGAAGFFNRRVRLPLNCDQGELSRFAAAILASGDSSPA